MSIWTDEVLRSVSFEAKAVYQALLTQPDLTIVGVLPYMPPRWAMLLGCTRDVIDAAVAELVTVGKVVVDVDTGELWVVDHLGFDEAGTSPNGAKSIARYVDAILSPTLRSLVLVEAHRKVLDHLVGFLPTAPPTAPPQGPSEGPPQGPTSLHPHNHLHLHPQDTRAADDPDDGSERGVEQQPLAALAVCDQQPGFDEFWKLYPRKVAKSPARKAFTKAVKRATATQIIEGLRVHLPAMVAVEERFIPHAATWLNGDRWADPPQDPDRLKPATRLDTRRRLLACADTADPDPMFAPIPASTVHVLDVVHQEVAP